jgi:hypothetical protein
MNAAELEQFLAASVADPLYFVMGGFQWGEGDLAPTPTDAKPGPDAWQIDILDLIAKKHLTVTEALQIAVPLGTAQARLRSSPGLCCGLPAPSRMHGDGHGQYQEPAGDQDVARGRALVQKRLIEPLRENFDITATKLFHKEHERTWVINAVPWSDNNPDAFAGMHGEWVLMIFDEASNIAKVIWEAAKGCMTTPHAIWIAFGNPWRNSGGFYDCFNGQRHRWHLRQIDSRTAKRANKSEIQKWIDDYGEDSDYVRIHVRGVFPTVGHAAALPPTRLRPLRPVIARSASWSPDRSTP